MLRSGPAQSTTARPCAVPAPGTGGGRAGARLPRGSVKFVHEHILLTPSQRGVPGVFQSWGDTAQVSVNLVNALLPASPNYEQLRNRKNAAVRRLEKAWAGVADTLTAHWVFDNMQRCFIVP